MAAKQAVSGLPYPLQESQVMNAWERLVCGVELPADAVRTVIERSWVRCHSAGVDPATTRAPAPTPDEDFTRLLHRFRDVIEVGAPVMEQVRESLSESGTMMILTDPSGVILKTEGEPATLEAAEDVRLVNGANWDELVCGTNAIGTALSLKEPVQVHATEHFCAGIKPWSCSAVVLRDPAYGEILGVLDVSGLSSRFHRNWLALAMMTAGRIEAELAARQMESRWRLAEAGLHRLSRASSSAVMLFDRHGRLVKAEGVSSHSRASLGACGDWSAGHRIEAFDTDSRHGEAALPDWLRPEWIQPVMRGGQRYGTVVVLPDSLRQEPARRIDTRATTSVVGQTSTTLGPIIGRSTALRQALERAKHLADLDVPVLLQGETGVGKEMFARAIHEGRQHTKGPFVALNCGGLPRDILASELFGYVDGAFTGAKRSGMIGKIETAHGGTLFLDEIGEMPLDLQPYLLRVLEGGELYPLGASQPRYVQFKLIAATNKDLRAEVAAGRFRQDLFYRVSVTTLRIPALRERKEDIAELVDYFNREVSHRHGVSVKRFEADVIDAFERYAWPGNVREMRHVVEGMVMLNSDDTLTAAALPEEIAAVVVAAASRPPHVSADTAAVPDLDAIERDAISTAIARRHGNLTMVAKELRISKSTLYLKIDKYGLNPSLRQARQHDR